MELRVKSTIDSGVQTRVSKPHELVRVIEGSTVQEKVTTHPTESRLQEIARHKVAAAAKRLGLQLKQRLEHEGEKQRHRSWRYAHAKQFMRLKKLLEFQRASLDIVIREERQKLDGQLQPGQDTEAPKARTLTALNTTLQRAGRIRRQLPKDGHKLYALHPPEAECISERRENRPNRFGVSVGLAITNKSGPMVGACNIIGNPYDAYRLGAQLEQVRNRC